MSPLVGSAVTALIAAIPPLPRASPSTASRSAASNTPETETETGTGTETASSSTTRDPTRPRGLDGQPLSDEQLAQVREMQATDRKVRQHEQAHLAAAGGLATSGTNYTMETGPDGMRYAVAGDVQIDVSPGRTPEETLRRARAIQAAALAPADPSSVDRAIAARAASMEQEALMEIASRSAESARVARAYATNDTFSGSFATTA
ncbi:putative metalloprotease CJM1_0395 family protein [Chitinilyticum aquatile]|uniref:putative metalloprotease CJM1_0395 family protein n=1 Tax=Chitinilyticum aquatile TaxID=362520 RepID=UPI0003FD84E4|nr:putative metalloprotease CJM1_0395 family protein [Chitinilyticum aquatile]